MNPQFTNPQPESKAGRRPGSGTGPALLAFLIIAAFFLITEHRAHLFGILPYALLLLALLLFVYLRRRQGNRGLPDEQPQAKEEE